MGVRFSQVGDISGGSKHTLTPPTYFQRVKTPNPQNLRPCTLRNRITTNPVMMIMMMKILCVCVCLVADTGRHESAAELECARSQSGADDTRRTTQSLPGDRRRRRRAGERRQTDSKLALLRLPASWRQHVRMSGLHPGRPSQCPLLHCAKELAYLTSRPLGNDTVNVRQYLR